MRAAVNEFGDWLHEPELVRLRGEWIAAFLEWDRVAASLVMAQAALSEEQWTKLRRYRATETAYFERCQVLAEPDDGRRRLV